MTDYDAVIVGAGPAGTAAAITLARAGRKVFVIEHRTAPRSGVSETIPPLAKGIVAHFMDLRVGDNHGLSESINGNISLWGDYEPQIQDFVFNPNGPGICVNRCGFDEALKKKAISKGVAIAHGTKLIALDWNNGTRSWTLKLDGKDGTREVSCGYLIDASGRHASVVKLLGLERECRDKLFSYSLKFVSKSGSDGDAYTRIEANSYGWWYSNRLPSNSNEDRPTERMVILHTDKDLEEARLAASSSGFLALLTKSTLIRDFLNTHQYEPVGKIHGAPAGNEKTLNGAVDGFVAIGDAAQAFDPLSSQGIFQALQTGSMAGQMINYELANQLNSGFEKPMPGKFLEKYTDEQKRIWTKYQQEYDYFYGAEGRWSEYPFWARRLASNSNSSEMATRQAS